MMIDEPVTDSEKIEWLWGRLDQMNADLAAVQESLKAETKKAERYLDQLSRERETSHELARQVSEMAIQLNQAKQSAANAVREHLAATGG